MREKSNLLNDIVLLSWSTLGQSAPATGAHSIEGLAPALNFSVAIFMTWLLIIPLTSGKDESTPVLSLAILKCTRSCPLRITQCYPQENVVVILFYNKSFDYLLTLLRSQDIGPHSFFCVHFHQLQHAKIGQNTGPAILTSSLINNPYIYLGGMGRMLVC